MSSSSITIRSTETLTTLRTVKLAPDVTGPLSSFAWSPSSSRLLVATTDQIHVFSVDEPAFHAAVRHPASGSGKPLARVQFGASENEILACSAFGLKFAIIDLTTGKTVEIGNPKFHLSSNVARGFSLRPRTGHLALLTRLAGRDAISLHHPTSRQPQKAWFPDTTDAAAVKWTPDGQWLLVWESPAHGPRLLLHTPDGQHFRTLDGSHISGSQDADLQPGIKLCQLSPNAELCVICHHGRGVAVLGTSSWRQVMQVHHPTTIVPKDTLQV